MPTSRHDDGSLRDPCPHADHEGVEGRGQGHDLEETAAEWRALRLRRHLLAVLLLMAVAVARWPFLIGLDPRGDERVYLQASEQVLAGGSPYDADGFFYPRPFADAVAFLLARLGDTATVVVFRALNLAGLCLSFWIAAAWLPLPLTWRWAACAAGLCLSPAVHAGLTLGNVSFFVAGLTLVALVLWPRLPLLAGVLLGAGVSLKPLAAGVILVLLAHRPRRGGWRHLSAAAAALAVAAALLLPFADVREMLGQEMVPLSYARSFSVHRLLGLVGLDFGRLQVTLAVLALAVAGARAVRMSSLQLLAYAVATVSLATPLVWSHTLIVALPVESLALALLWHRARDSRTGVVAGRWPVGRWFEPAFVVLWVVMIHAGTAAGFDDLGPWVQAIFLLYVGLTPAALAAYVFALTEGLEVP